MKRPVPLFGVGFKGMCVNAGLISPSNFQCPVTTSRIHNKNCVAQFLNALQAVFYIEFFIKGKDDNGKRGGMWGRGFQIFSEKAIRWAPNEGNILPNISKILPSLFFLVEKRRWDEENLIILKPDFVSRSESVFFV